MPTHRIRDESSPSATSYSVSNALSQVLGQGVAITGDISFDLSDLRRPTMRTNLLLHLAGRTQEAQLDMELENRRLWAQLREMKEANRHLAQRLARLETVHRAAERRARLAARAGVAEAEGPPHVSRYDILVAVAAQPQGITLAQLAEELAVCTDTLSAPLEDLLAMGEIVQRDDVYQMPRRERPPVAERPPEVIPEEVGPARVPEPVLELIEDVLADVQAVLTSRLAGKPAAEAEEALEAEAPPAAETEEALEAEAPPAAEAEEALEAEASPAAEAEEALEAEAPPAAEVGEIGEVEIEFEPEEVEVEEIVIEPPPVEEEVAPVEEAPPPAEVEPRRLPPDETKEHILAALRDQQVGLTLPELGIALKRPWQGLIPLVKALMNEGLVEKHNKWYYPAAPTSEDDLLALITARPGLTLPQLGEALGVKWQGLTRRVRELVDSQAVEKRDQAYYSKI